ncbi:MAG TPA: gephyrin-like molybdotransferase Glp [Solirubrobacteraceae bacterium]|jgi:molybdopterin molybdotransferase|nr:gephyrin-like molybdotransferase Glp [Solirubrobacteraceae bacterium]
MAAGLLPLEDAIDRVLATVATLGVEEVPLDAALGRVLAEDVTSREPVPAFANSAMDGFAIRSADVRDASDAEPVSLHVTAESRAGAPAEVAVSAGEAVAISTGAALPRGADAVIRLEDVQREDGHVLLRRGARSGQDVREAGEDVRAGQTVLCAGARLGAAELGVLGTLGRDRVACAHRARAAVLVSGDELIAPGQPRRAGGVRDANSFSVPALVTLEGAEVRRVTRVADDERATRRAIAAAAKDADIVLVCGGVSVGAHDHVRPSLRELGARQVFWGVALKPGRPTWFGTLDRAAVFGLPGNPVSAMASFLLLVRPALARMSRAAHADRRAVATLSEQLRKPAGRTHAVRCRLRLARGGVEAQPTGAQGSHILTSMARAHVLALLPREATVVEAGERVEIEPISPWLLPPT